VSDVGRKGRRNTIERCAGNEGREGDAKRHFPSLAHLVGDPVLADGAHLLAMSFERLKRRFRRQVAILRATRIDLSYSAVRRRDRR
jgi:hypothetical protein